MDFVLLYAIYIKYNNFGYSVNINSFTHTKKNVKKLNNTTFFTWLWADRAKSRRLILLLTDIGVFISYHFIQKGFGLNPYIQNWFITGKNVHVLDFLLMLK